MAITLVICKKYICYKIKLAHYYSQQFSYSNVYTKIQPQSIIGSGEEDNLSVFTILSMAAILFNSAKPCEQIVSVGV